MIEISIIVPVYNVERYLKKCIDSILSQTFTSFELILVDDGSTDYSGEICDIYKKKDSRVKVIHKKNEGLSSARNTGLEFAKGKYIAFVDSDDYINKNMYEILYNNIIKTNSDISMCNFKYINDDSISDNDKEIDSYEYFIFDNIEALNKLYLENNIYIVVAWNKLYKKDVFKKLRYSEGKIHEDEFIIHSLLYNSKKIIYVDLQLYYYLQRNNSITKSKFNIKKLDIVYALSERVKFFRIKKLKNLEFKAQEKYIYSFFFNYYKCKTNLSDCKVELKKLKSDYNKNLIFILLNPHFNYREKFLFVLFFINPKYYELYNKKIKKVKQEI